MTRDEVIHRMAQRFPDAVSAINTMPVDEKVVLITPESFREVITWLLLETGFTHLTTITAQNIENGIALMYHFWHRQGLTLKVVLQISEKCIPSLVEQLPGAAFYEREVAEMYGLDFKGHAGMLPLFTTPEKEAEPGFDGQPQSERDA
jgi:NADH:ubiquinone oxidoreductase subunit C